MFKGLKDRLSIPFGGAESFSWSSVPLIFQMVFFYLPILLMLGASLLDVSQGSDLPRLTLDHFHSICSRAHLLVIVHSLSLSVTTSFLCLAIAYPLAYFIASKSRQLSVLLLLLLIVPFWTNMLLHAYAWFFVLERHGFLNSLLLHMEWIQEPLAWLHSLPAVVMLMVYHYLPFAVLPIFASLDRFDTTLLESAYDLGASRRGAFVTILLPLTLPAVRIGSLLVFVPSFGEFIIPQLMGGDRFYFVGTLVSDYLLGNGTRELGAAFMTVSIAVLVLSTYLIHRLFHYLEMRLTRRGVG